MRDGLLILAVALAAFNVGQLMGWFAREILEVIARVVIRAPKPDSGVVRAPKPEMVLPQAPSDPAVPTVLSMGVVRSPKPNAKAVAREEAANR